MKVTRKLQKWGNSTAIRLPKQALEALELKDGEEMVVHVRQEGLLLTPKADEDFSLADLLHDATPAKVGGELDWGQLVGKELLPDE
jgi:antitoxin MazE